MCELMGYNFAKPTQAAFSIREFARRDAENADGWGVTAHRLVHLGGDAEVAGDGAGCGGLAAR